MSEQMTLDLPNTSRTVNDLKESGEDFEWYPTTTEIRRALWRDICKRGRAAKYSYSTGLRIDESYHRDEKHHLRMERMLDIGSGDGRILLDPIVPKNVKVCIEQCIGIEKSQIHADSLIAKGVWMLGRDYMKMTLIDKSFDVVFCNPPYSEFKAWVYKMMSEVNATYTYLCIPKRWKHDEALHAAVSRKGNVDIIGHYDFSTGDREARAKVDLLCISKTTDTADPFTNWVTENIGSFTAREDDCPGRTETEPEEFNEVSERKDIATTLVENYEREMHKLITTYKTLDSIDFALLEQLGIHHSGVMEKILSDIQTLKHRYWEKAFSHISSFKTRLTYKTANSILDEIKGFKELDFNADNIRNIVIWVIENFNRYSKEQLLQCYDDMTYFGSVRAYKSNNKWIDDGWRYQKMNDGKGMPEKSMLDYRIVTYGRLIGKQCFADDPGWNSGWGYDKPNENIISDLCVVVASLGFPRKAREVIDNDGNKTYVQDSEIRGVVFGKNQEIVGEDGKVLFTFRVYKNRNVHIKIRSDILQKLNIEVGKLKGWIKSPSDIQSEFETTESEAVELFGASSINLMSVNTTKLLA